MTYVVSFRAGRPTRRAASSLTTRRSAAGNTPAGGLDPAAHWRLACHKTQRCATVGVPVSHAPDIAALYAAHRDELLRWFARRTADAETALDLVAETFAQAVRTRRRCRASSDSERAAWLYAIARHQLAGYHRRGYAELRAVGKLGLERPPLTEAVLREVEMRAGLDEVRGQLSAAMASLTEETRAAVTLRVIDELPYPDVAARLGIAEPAARTRVSRGLTRLADVLDRQLLEEVTT